MTSELESSTKISTGWKKIPTDKKKEKATENITTHLREIVRTKGESVSKKWLCVSGQVRDFYPPRMQLGRDVVELWGKEYPNKWSGNSSFPIKDQCMDDRIAWPKNVWNYQSQYAPDRYHLTEWIIKGLDSGNLTLVLDKGRDEWWIRLPKHPIN